MSYVAPMKVRSFPASDPRRLYGARMEIPSSRASGLNKEIDNLSRQHPRDIIELVGPLGKTRSLRVFSSKIVDIRAIFNKVTAYCKLVTQYDFLNKHISSNEKSYLPYTESITIPSGLVGLILGKHGATLVWLRKKHATSTIIIDGRDFGTRVISVHSPTKYLLGLVLQDIRAHCGLCQSPTTITNPVQ